MRSTDPQFLARDCALSVLEKVVSAYKAVFIFYSTFTLNLYAIL
jgi:hypothetical protein